MWSYNVVQRGHELYQAVTAPISCAQFRTALYAVFGNDHEFKTRRMGIAVSGGADSMALATLCTELARDDGLPVPIAFIVDHQLRKESNEEAQWVCDQLSKKAGLRAVVLKPKWPRNSIPMQASRLETLARTFRYRALGDACRDSATSLLLIGHHRQDEYENSLLRIVRQRYRSLGLNPVVEIPECHGIHGVHESGGLNSSLISSDREILAVERGGIQVIRPLLDFPKPSLIATCVAHNTSWVEDPTNQDPTLTPRNALRHIMKKYLLANSLQEKEIVCLAQHSRKKKQYEARSVEKLFNSCKLQLDVRSGLLRLEIPGTVIKENRELLYQDDSKVAAALLRRLAALHSPRKALLLNDFQEMTDIIFPNPARPVVKMAMKDKFYSAGSLRYHCIDPEKNIWHISRENSTPRYLLHLPFSADLQGLDPLRNPRRLVSKALEIPSTDDATNVETAPFHLFDNRFWIRVHNPTPLKVRIRFPMMPDIQAIREGQDRKNPIYALKNVQETIGQDTILTHGKVRNSNSFNFALHEAARGFARYSLPLIEVYSDEHKGRLVALPTFDVSAMVDVDETDPSIRAQYSEIQWDVRYRKIDLGLHDPKRVLINGFMAENRLSEEGLSIGADDE